ncbi:MAG: hypothetical protein ACI8P9_000734 [Parasphingorhabdus sp.]
METSEQDTARVRIQTDPPAPASEEEGVNVSDGLDEGSADESANDGEETFTTQHSVAYKSADASSPVKAFVPAKPNDSGASGTGNIEFTVPFVVSDLVAGVNQVAVQCWVRDAPAKLSLQGLYGGQSEYFAVSSRGSAEGTATISMNAEALPNPGYWLCGLVGQLKNGELCEVQPAGNSEANACSNYSGPGQDSDQF